jgi:hypothetical protein
MKQDGSKHDGPEETQGDRGHETPRPAPGKVTLASRLSRNPGSAVQRTAAEPRPEDSSYRSSADLTGALSMDLAHRGLAALSGEETGESSISRASAGRQSIQMKTAATGVGAGRIVQMDEAERRAGEAIPAELRARLFERLRASTEIQAVLEEIRGARGNLSFAIKWSSRGSYHRNGEIHLDLNGDEESWTASLAHELVHLSTFVCGRAADVNANTREEFVRLKMEDEINSQATQYIALLQMGNETATPAGYQEFRTHLRGDHAELLANERWSRIKEIARAWLEDKYRNEWVTSNTGVNYYEYWGSFWDRQHRR